MSSSQLESFNAKFRNSILNDQASNLASSLTFASFKRRSIELKKNSAKTLQWLRDVDKIKGAVTYSIRPRFVTMTSENVNSVNKVMLEARERPLLMTVEKYIGIKWVEFVAKAASWWELKAFATNEFERKRFVSVVDKHEIIPSCLSSFVAKVRKDGELNLDYSVDLENPKNPCFCGYFGDMNGTCSHLNAALGICQQAVATQAFLRCFVEQGVVLECLRPHGRYEVMHDDE